jgi:ferrous iron transport protein A
MRIDQLQPGQTATITRIDDGARDGRRLRELGFDEGVEVEVRHRGMLGGDPIAVFVGGNLVAMRRAFARLVDVTPVAEAAE